MAEKLPKSSSKERRGKKALSERALQIYRDLNLGAAVLWGAGAVLIPPAAPVFAGLAALDVVQAGGAEIVRRGVKKKRKKREAKS
jgi:hypothetical protein